MTRDACQPWRGPSIDGENYLQCDTAGSATTGARRRSASIKHRVFGITWIGTDSVSISGRYYTIRALTRAAMTSTPLGDGT